MPQIEFDHVSKYFMNEKRRFAAIDELSLSIEAGDFVFLIGSSGAGKTTLLRLLANHITPEEGAIWVEGQQINRIPQWRRPLYRRRIGQVWQEPALIRKKTIGENLEIVQRAMGVSNRVIPQNTLKALSIVGMRTCLLYTSFIQGFYFYRPLDLDALGRLLETPEGTISH